MEQLKKIETSALKEDDAEVRKFFYEVSLKLRRRRSQQGEALSLLEMIAQQ